MLNKIYLFVKKYIASYAIDFIDKYCKRLMYSIVKLTNIFV